MKKESLIYKILIKYQVLLPILVIIDQVTKIIANKNLDLNNTVVLIKNFLEFKLTYNTGVAFSMLNNAPGIVMVLISFVGFGLLEYFAIKQNEDKILKVGLTIIAAGAIGNGIDRFLMLIGIYDGVIDFINMVPDLFPATFNVADIYVTVSCIGLLIYMLFSKDDSNEPSFRDLRKAKKKLAEEAKSNLNDFNENENSIDNKEVKED